MEKQKLRTFFDRITPVRESYDALNRIGKVYFTIFYNEQEQYTLQKPQPWKQEGFVYKERPLTNLDSIDKDNEWIKNAREVAYVVSTFYAIKNRYNEFYEAVVLGTDRMCLTRKLKDIVSEKRNKVIEQYRVSKEFDLKRIASGKNVPLTDIIIGEDENERQ